MTDSHGVADTASTTGPQQRPAPVEELDDERRDDERRDGSGEAIERGPGHRDVPDTEANKGVALAFIKGVFIDQDPAAVDRLAAADFTPHTFGDLPPGREPLKEAMRRAGAGVSDTTFDIHDVIAEQDRVAVRLTTHARHTGLFMGVPASGNEYSIDEIHIFRIRNGTVTEHWHEFDRLALLRQLSPPEPHAT